MCLAYYSVGFDNKESPKNCILTVYKNNQVVQTFHIPVGKPVFFQKRKVIKQANELGSMLVRKIMDLEYGK